MRRTKRQLLVILAASVLVLAGNALAAPGTALASEKPVCAVHSLSSFVAQGEFPQASSVADIIEVKCESVYHGDRVKIAATALYDRCEGRLSWSVPYPYIPLKGRSYSAKLDGDGRAIVALWGGPFCATGESLISAHLEAAPYSTATTDFTILAPKLTEAGVTALTPNGESSEIENSVSGSVATIVQVEFPSVYAGRPVQVSAEQLFSSCKVAPKLLWIGADEKIKGIGVEAIKGLALDEDGNAFVVLLAGASCAPTVAGEISAFIEGDPSVSGLTTFTVLPPE
jgi:hypothetical protein